MRSIILMELQNENILKPNKTLIFYVNGLHFVRDAIKLSSRNVHEN